MAFLKNIGKSVVYVFKDVVAGKDGVLKDTAEFIERSYGTVSAIQGDILKWWNESDEIFDFLKEVKSTVKRLPGQIVSDVKKGTLANIKNLQKIEADKIKAMGLDFDLNAGFSMPDVDKEKGRVSVFKESDIVAGTTVNAPVNIVAAAAGQGKAGNRKFRISSEIALRQLESSNVSNTLLNKLLEFNLTRTTEFYDKTASFYTEMSSKISQIGERLSAQMSFFEPLKKLAEKVTETYFKEEKWDRIKVSRQRLLRGGGFDAEDYYKLVKSNMSGGSMSMMAEAGLLGAFKDAVKSFGASPISAMTTMMAARYIPEVIKTSVQSLNTVVKAFGSQFINLANKWADSDVPILKFFGQMFGYRVSTGKPDFTNYEKGAVPFDGVTRKHITHAIPSLLSKILSAIKALNIYDPSRDSGGNIVFDADTLKFQTKEQVISKNAENDKSRRERYFGEYTKDIIAQLQKNGMLQTPEQAAAQKDRLLKVFEDIAKSQKLFQEGKEGVEEKAKDFGVSDEQSFELLKKWYKQNSHLVKTGMRDRSARFVEDSASEKESRLKSNVQSLLDENSDLPTIIRHPGGLDRYGEKGWGGGEPPPTPIPSGLSPEDVSRVVFTQQKKLHSETFDQSVSGRVAYYIDRLGMKLNSVFFGDEDGKDFLDGITKTFESLGDTILGPNRDKKAALVDQVWKKVDDTILKPMSDFVNDKAVPFLQDKILTPAMDLLLGKERNRELSIFKQFNIGLSEKIFNPLQDWLFGEKYTKGAKGLMGHARVPFTDVVKNYFTKEVAEPFNRYMQEYVYTPIKTYFDTVFGPEVEKFKAASTEWYNKNKQYVKGAGTGMLVGMIMPGGPILGGLLGLAYSTDTVQKYLYGDAEIGTKGLITPEVSAKAKKLGLGAVWGAGAGLVTSIILPGGPLVGGLLGMAYQTDTAQKFLYGDGKDDKGYLTPEMQKKLKELGATSMGAGLFGAMFLPGGAVTGVLLNLAYRTDTAQKFLYGKDGKGGMYAQMKKGLASVQDSFSKIVYGDEGADEKDEFRKKGVLKYGREKFAEVYDVATKYFFGDVDALTGERKGDGLFGKLYQLGNTEVYQPLKASIEESISSMGVFFQEKVLNPLKNTFEPFVTELKIQAANFADMGRNFISGVATTFNDGFKESFGVDLVEMLKGYVIQPIKDVLKSVKDLTTSILKNILLFPIKMVKGAADWLRERHKTLEAAGQYSWIFGKKDETAAATENTAAEAKKEAQFINADGYGVSGPGIGDTAKAPATAVLQNFDGLGVSGPGAEAHPSASAAVLTPRKSEAVMEDIVKATSVSAEATTDIKDKTSGIYETLISIKDKLFSYLPKAGGDAMTAPETAAAKSPGKIGPMASNILRIANSTERIESTATDVLSVLKASLGGKLTDEELAAVADMRFKKPKSLLGRIFDFIVSPFRNLGETLSSLGEKVWDFVTAPFRILKDAVSGFYDYAVSAGKEILGGIGKVFKSAGSLLASILEVPAAIMKAMASGIATAARIAGDVLVGVGDEHASSHSLRQRGDPLQGIV